MDTMLRGRMGVLVGLRGGDDDEPPAAAAEAIAVATGMRVSRRQPAGTQPCLLVSESTWPEPAGSRCTTHQPRAREMITKVSPLRDTHHNQLSHKRSEGGSKRQGEIPTRPRQIRRLALPCTDKWRPHTK